MAGLSKNKIKWIRSLHSKKYRDELGLFLVEGEKMVIEALKESPALIEEVYATCELDISSFTGLFELISDSELSQISTLKTPNKALAVLRKPEKKNATFSSDLTLVLDGIQDPGNMGTILRTADWFGYHTIVCSEDSADIFNPKVIQASMGSILRMNVCYTSLESYLKNCQLPIYGALLEGKNVFETSLEKHAVLIMGNEGKGIRPEIQKFINSPIHIPGKGKAESLNVAMATGILLSEFSRSIG